MEFFPHRIPPTTVGRAVSASLALSASYVSNTSSTIVASASLALNISGSAGSPGANFTRTGTTGTQGTTGPRGFRGKNVYLLSVGWGTGSKAICYSTDGLGNATYTGTEYVCDYSLPQLYYADASTLTNGVTLYYDSGCTTVASNLSSKSDPTSNGIFNTDGSGVITFTGNNCGSNV